MHVHPKSRRPLCLGLAALLACALGLAPQPPAEQHLWEFVPASPTPDRPATRHAPWIIREQKIRLHQPTLETLRNPGQSIPSGIRLDLTDDTSREMIIDSKTPGALTTTVIQGHLGTAPHSDVTFVIKDSTVAGTIRMDRRVFRIQSIGNGEHLLVEIDPEKLPPD